MTMVKWLLANPSTPYLITDKVLVVVSTQFGARGHACKVPVGGVKGPEMGG